jgi:tetratricopeptide (TPR) repeat protein
MDQLVGLLQYQHNYDEAIPLARRMLEIRRRLLGNEHADSIAALNTLAALLQDQGELAEAEQHSARAVELARMALAQDHWLTAMCRANYGRCLLKLRRYEEAEPQLLAGYSGLAAAFGKEHEQAKRVGTFLVSLYDAWGKPEQAAEWRAQPPTTQPAPTGDGELLPDKAD